MTEPASNQPQNELIILAHQPEPKPHALCSVMSAFVAYLATFGVTPKYVADEEWFDLRTNNNNARASLIRVMLAGNLSLDHQEFAAELRAFLKKAAKNGDTVATFDLYMIEDPMKKCDGANEA